MFLADAVDSFPRKSVSLQVTHVNKPGINFQRKEKLAIQYFKHRKQEKKNQHDFPALRCVAQIWVILLKTGLLPIFTV